VKGGLLRPYIPTQMKKDSNFPERKVWGGVLRDLFRRLSKRMKKRQSPRRRKEGV